VLRGVDQVQRVPADRPAPLLSGARVHDYVRSFTSTRSRIRRPAASWGSIVGYASLGDIEKLRAIVFALAGDVAQIRASLETVRALERGLANRIARLEQVDDPKHTKGESNAVS